MNVKYMKQQEQPKRAKHAFLPNLVMHKFIKQLFCVMLFSIKDRVCCFWEFYCSCCIGKLIFKCELGLVFDPYRAFTLHKNFATRKYWRSWWKWEEKHFSCGRITKWKQEKNKDFEQFTIKVRKSNGSLKTFLF